MVNNKDQVYALLQRLSEEVSYEDIQYHLYVFEKVQRSLRRVESDGAVAHEDVKARLGQWLAS